MNQLAAQPAFDPAAMRQEIHEAEEENSNPKCEERGNVRIHVSMEMDYGGETSSLA